MNSFTVTTLITKKDYIAYLITSIYKRPLTIIMFFVGLYMLLMVARPSLFGYPTSPVSNLVFGLFLVLNPFIITFILSAKFNAIPSMRHEIVYTFSEDLIVIKASTFDATMQWSHFIKLRETKRFLLLQSSKRTASLIDKTKITQEQIQFIKSKIGKK